MVDSGLYGIRPGPQSVVEHCVVRIADFGIWSPANIPGVIIRSCEVSGCEFDGIVIPDTSIAIGCLSSSNFSDGFVVGTSSLVMNCVAHENSGVGILVSGTACIIEGNTVTNTQFGDAIRVTSECRVSHNLCHNNTAGAGILATGNFNWIDGNNCITNDWGVKVDGSDNWIVRNRVEDWNIAGFDIAAAMNNKLGTIQGTPVSAGALHNFDF